MDRYLNLVKNINHIKQIRWLKISKHILAEDDEVDVMNVKESTSKQQHKKSIICCSNECSSIRYARKWYCTSKITILDINMPKKWMNWILKVMGAKEKLKEYQWFCNDNIKWR
jgi:hypothetical protein